jgi:hypothetical protein
MKPLSALGTKSLRSFRLSRDFGWVVHRGVDSPRLFILPNALQAQIARLTISLLEGKLIQKRLVCN